MKPLTWNLKVHLSHIINTFAVIVAVALLTEQCQVLKMTLGAPVQCGAI